MTTPENTIRASLPTPSPSYKGALGSRDFGLLWVGQLGSEIGNGAVQLALPWLVLDLTGSALQLGLAYFFLFSPMLIFGIPGGVLVDRWDRRMTIVVVDALRAVAFLSVAIIYYMGELTIEHIYAVLFLESSLANFFNPARAALMPNLVSPEALRPANSLMEVSRSIGFLAAPPAGALVIGLLGPASIMMFDGATFGLSAVLVFLIRWRQPPRVNAVSESFRHAVEIAIEQTKAGMKAIARERILQVCMVLGFSLNLIVGPIQLLLPLFVRDVKGAGEYYFGLLVGALLVGLIIGSLTVPMTSKRVGLGRLAIASIVLLGVIICVAPWPAGLYPPVAAMLVAGVAIGGLSVAQTSMLQSSTTDEERGRVSASYYTFSLGVRPFGFLAIGALASTVDIRVLFTVLGVAAIFVGLGLLRLQDVRDHQ